MTPAKRLDEYTYPNQSDAVNVVLPPVRWPPRLAFPDPAMEKEILEEPDVYEREEELR